MKEAQRHRGDSSLLDQAARRQQTLYDGEYGRLPTNFSGFEKWRLSFIKRNFQALDLQAGDRFLDIGVGGTGYTVLAAAEIGARAIGIDISTVACRAATSYRDQLHMEHDASFLACSATHLPFLDRSFDKIVCNAILEHVEDDGLAMDEIRRVCAPAGRVVICVPNTYLTTSWPLSILNLVNDPRVGHIRHYAASDIALRLGRRGFRVIDITYHGHLIKMPQLILSKLAPSLRRNSSRLWWALEQYDLSLRDNPSSVNVTVTLERE